MAQVQMRKSKQRRLREAGRRKVYYFRCPECRRRLPAAEWAYPLAVCKACAAALPEATAV